MDVESLLCPAVKISHREGRSEPNQPLRAYPEICQALEDSAVLGAFSRVVKANANQLTFEVGRARFTKILQEQDANIYVLQEPHIPTVHAEADQRRVFQTLTVKHENLLTAVNDLSDCMIICDRFGMIELLNQRFQDIFPHIQIEDFIGRPVLTFVEQVLYSEAPENDLLLRAKLRWLAKRLICSESISFTFRSKSGLYLEYRDTIADKGERIGLLIDESSYHALHEQLEIACSQALELSDAKSQFMAAMGHEIRTPLNVIIGLLDLCISDPARADAQNLKLAQTNAHNLLKLLNHVLDYTKFEAEKVALTPVSTNLRELCERALFTFAAQSPEKSKWVDLYVDPSMSEEYLCDEVRLSQVLNNLLSNAFKFNRSTSPSVSLNVELVEQGSLHKLKFSIRDNGIGMTTEEQNRVFTGFMQASPSIHNQFGGTGLGLSICQKICHLMGSKLKVDSTIDVGSTFYFTVPLEPSPTKTNPFVSLHNKGLLMLCNHRKFVESLRLYGHHFGFECLFASLEEILNVCQPEHLILVYPPDRDDEASSAIMHAIDKLPNKKAIIGQAGQLSHYFGQARVDLMPLTLSQLCAIIEGKVTPELEKSEPHYANALGVTLKILVVEDNLDNVFVMKRQLSTFGVEAEYCTDPTKAVDCFKSGQFDLVLSDYQMPKMTGAELVGTLRDWEQKHNHKRAFMAVLTADKTLDCKQLCEAAGVDKLFIKPLPLNSLKAYLSQVGSRSQASAIFHPKFNERPLEHDFDADTDLFIDPAIFETSDKPTSGEPSTEHPVNPNVLLKYIGENHEHNLPDFWQQASENLQTRSDELQAAADKYDVPTINTLAHKIKSSALYFGAENLSQLCEELEELAEFQPHNGDHVLSQLAKVKQEINHVVTYLAQEC